MRQPTMEDVAERAGVSRALVSLVLHDSPKVSAHRRAAVLEAARELGYRPNAMARGLAQRRSRTVGLVLNDLHNPFFADTADGVQATAAEHGYRVLLGTSHHSREGEELAIETFLEFRTEGVVLVGPVVDDELLDRTARSVPVVAVARDVPGDSVDSVINDDHAGAMLAVQHLVDLGHRRIAHISAGDGAGGAERLAGYTEAMAAAGLAQHMRVVDGDFTDRRGAAAAAELLATEQPPTAIFAANDFSAAGALDCIEDAGLRVPEDVSIVGYDNTALAAMHHLSLTTVNQPREEMGRLAMAAVIERLEEDRTKPIRHVLAPSLVARATSGPPPA